jgi:hypothetical protein
MAQGPGAAFPAVRPPACKGRDRAKAAAGLPSHTAVDDKHEPHRRGAALGPRDWIAAPGPVST